ncbi:MAG: type II toxin-antitoxin system HicA family toxin [Actinomycetota bacterium]|nr:type II toxin-antitoxin system HicA family toxin [Actinomycetota bacterium]
MKPISTKALRTLLQAMGCEKVAVVGSHEKWRGPGGHTCTIKAGVKQQAPGTLRAIQASLAPELGERWLEVER